jgi:predicted kinase
MNYLLFTRGVPGCGKSTFIKNMGWEPYTLSSDIFRMQHGSLTFNSDGTQTINQKVDAKAWKSLYKTLDYRMSRGEFTVMDATHVSNKSLKEYKTMAKHYRYKIVCIDFSSVPLEDALLNNELREGYKFVPEEVIQNMYTKMNNQTLASSIEVIPHYDSTAIFDYFTETPIDVTPDFDKLVFLGDIQGCFDPLKKYFDTHPFDNKTQYIFTGDLIDRGIQNAEVVRFLLDYQSQYPDNFKFVMGNHDQYLKAWAEDDTTVKLHESFNKGTKPQLEAAGITKKEVRKFMRSFYLKSYIKFDDKEFIVTHGGLADFQPFTFYLNSTFNTVKGQGTYDDDISGIFTSNNLTNNRYQVHGHRNSHYIESDMHEKSFNLEGSIEYGGALKIVEYSKANGFNHMKFENEIIDASYFSSVPNQLLTVQNIVPILESNHVIKTKTFKNIKVFNFTKRAFFDRIWNSQTITARGLMININDNTVAARGYNKFFNVNERKDTKLEALCENFQFPIRSYYKENGFLGISGYNSKTDELMLGTKAFVSDYAELFKDLLTPIQKNKLKKINKELNVSCVFEVIHHKDPHIIDPTPDRVILLDVISRDLEGIRMSDEDKAQIALKLGVQCVELDTILYNAQELTDYYNNTQDENYFLRYRNCEGFVLNDSNGNQVKIKTLWYKTFKKLRAAQDALVKTGQVIMDASDLFNTDLLAFHCYMRRQSTADLETKTISELRLECGL